MNDVLILLILVIPSLVLGLLWWSQSRAENDLKRKTLLIQAKNEKSKIVTPLKITAYERLIAMLERFKLFGLLMRNNEGSVGSSQLQLELINAIRSEFEMNISMQMYVSNTVWHQIEKGKDQSLNSIKTSGMKVGAEATAMKLSQEIIKLEEEHKNREIQKAIEMLKHEINQTVLNG